MRVVEIDREGDGFQVKWIQGLQPVQVRQFSARNDAEAFALKKMGRRGCIVSTLDMTEAQLAARAEKVRRYAALYPPRA